MEKNSQGFLKIMMDFSRCSDVLLVPFKKSQSCTVDRSLFGPSSPHKLLMCLNRDGECPQSSPFRTPEINSLVDINDGDEKGKGSYVIMQHQ